jgi:hypothetical protein
VAGAQAVLDGSPSFGAASGFDDVSFNEGASEGALSPSTSVGNMSRAAERLQPPPRRVHTSDDAARQQLRAAAPRACGGCGGAPFRGYRSVFTYLVGFGWLLDAVGANGPPVDSVRIRRSMSSRIAVDSANPTPDDD